MDVANQPNMLNSTVAQLEAQAMGAQAMGNYGLGIGDVRMDGQGGLSNQAMAQQMSMSQASSNPASLAMSTNASVAANMNDIVNGQGQLLRRPSGTASNGPQQMASMGMNMSNASSDLSSEVHEKLSLIER